MAEVVTTQPRSKRKEVEEFVRDLDPVQVCGMLLQLCEWVLCVRRLRGSRYKDWHGFARLLILSDYISRSNYNSHSNVANVDELLL